jgi:acyl-CoA synthetase (AMP-forming)/AMP-acid ligase II
LTNFYRIGGFTYNDITHIFGVSRAGYIPQLFSLRLPNPEIIYSLMQRAGAKALIFESSFAANVAELPLPTFLAIPKDSMNVTGVPIPTLRPVVVDDTAFIFHTSGSTSGSPKLVPCSYRWLASAIHKSDVISKPFNLLRQDVSVWM